MAAPNRNHGVNRPLARLRCAQNYVSPVSALTGRNRLIAGHPGAPRYVTRYQHRLVRDSFMFLNLPYELRLMVYEYCVDISGTQKTINRYYQVFKDARDAAAVVAPLVYLRTPTIFCLNRQIYSEARTVLAKRSITFNHGMLDLANLDDFISTPVLRTLHSITVNDTGHDLFHGTKNPANSWFGYMELVEQLGKILMPAGHHVKVFNLSIASKEFEQHVTKCWDQSFVCGYRDTLKKVLLVLGQVRNVECVSFHGFPEPLATNLKNAMQRPSLNLFSLPRNIRDKIYRYATNLFDVTVMLNRALRTAPDKSRIKFPKLSTPTVLLLNRQITAEARRFVRILTIAPSSIVVARAHTVPSILHFITIPTLRRVEELHIFVKNWECIDILATLLPVFSKRHSLKRLFLSFKDSHDITRLAARSCYPDIFLHNYLAPLADIRGLETVEFARNGSLPLCYTDPLSQIMLSKPVKGEVLPNLLVKKGDYSVVDVDTVMT